MGMVGGTEDWEQVRSFQLPRSSWQVNGPRITPSPRLLPTHTNPSPARTVGHGHSGWGRPGVASWGRYTSLEGGLGRESHFLGCKGAESRGDPGAHFCRSQRPRGKWEIRLEKAHRGKSGVHGDAALSVEPLGLFGGG